MLQYDTRHVGYEVEEQFPSCTTVNMEKCKDVTIGLITENKCEVWPVQQCSVENRTVTHSQPRTECRKEPRELCAPGDCPLVEVTDNSPLRYPFKPVCRVPGSVLTR